MRNNRNLRRDPAGLLTRDEAKELLSPLAEDWLMPSLQFGLDRMAELPPNLRVPLGKRELAAMLNCYVVDDAKKHVDLVSGVRLHEDHGFPTFVVEGKASLRIKKINNEGKPSNYPTKQQREVQYQMELPGIGPATWVTFGYRLDELWREIKQVSFVCWRGNHLRWEIPVADDLSAYLPTIAAEERRARRAVVRPKQNRMPTEEAKRG